jgi:hypothetical protein
MRYFLVPDAFPPGDISSGCKPSSGSSWFGAMFTSAWPPAHHPHPHPLVRFIVSENVVLVLVRIHALEFVSMVCRLFLAIIRPFVREWIVASGLNSA